MDINIGNFRHHSDQPTKSHLRLCDLHLTDVNPTHPSSCVLSVPSFTKILSEARKTFEEAPTLEVGIVIANDCMQKWSSKMDLSFNSPGH